MSWLEHHTASEQLAAEAEIAAREGDSSRSKVLYARAADAERLACEAVEPSKSRTLGVSAVSAASLFFKAAKLSDAESLAYRWLGSGLLPDFAREHLRGMLQSIWSEQIRERAGIGFAPGQVVVSVSGGEIIEGGAPLDLIVEKVQTVQSLFYRTAEFLRGLPHRRRGAPIKEIQESCRPWLFQAAPGSYQFAVAVQEPRQMDWLNAGDPTAKKVADHFLLILRASSEAPQEELPALVPDPDYRTTFLKLTRSLAPTGKRFGKLDVRSADEAQAVSLVPSTRAAVGQAIRASRPEAVEEREEPQTLLGILRALHLDHDWIEVTVGEEHKRVEGVGEAVDDVIGPMVNHAVSVQVVRDARGTLRFRDIELDE